MEKKIEIIEIKLIVKKVKKDIRKKIMQKILIVEKNIQWKKIQIVKNNIVEK